jgi:hypothetical protein
MLNILVFEHEVVGVASRLAEIAFCVRGTDVSALSRAAVISSGRNCRMTTNKSGAFEIPKVARKIFSF